MHRHFNAVDFKNAMLSHGGIRDVRVSVVDASTVVDEGHAASNQVGRLLVFRQHHHRLEGIQRWCVKAHRK